MSSDDDALDAGARASDAAARTVAELLTSSHRLAPVDLAERVAVHTARLGARDTRILLADLSQRALLPFTGGSASPADAEELEIDGTVAGRAFRSGQVVTIPGVDGGHLVHVPLVDGADRLGVLRIDLPPGPGVDEEGWRVVASLVAELITSKSTIGDPIPVGRRRQPLGLAAELRWAFLPPLTFCNHQIEIAAILEPAYEIAGDSFDYAVNEVSAHVAIVDAMGHGLEASRIANLAVAAYRHGRRHGLDLTATLRAMDEIVADQFGPERFVTGQLARIELDSGVLHLLSAGHPRPLLLRDGHLVGELECTTQLPIGLGDVDVVTAQVALQPGDRVLFYTDGVVEARSAQGEEFGLERLGDLAARAVASNEPAAEIARRLIHSVLAHEAGNLRDDATVVLVGWPGS